MPAFHKQPAPARRPPGMLAAAVVSVALNLVLVLVILLLARVL